MQVKINKMGINGEGIAYYNNKVVFIDGCFLHEVVEIKDLVLMGGYYKATLDKIIVKSPYRMKASCPSYKKCRACSLMELKYPQQLAYKKAQLQEALYKYAKISSDLVENIEPTKNLNYRNQLKLPIKMVNGKLVTGMYEANSNRLVVVNKCIVHEEGLEEIRKHVLNVLNKYKLKAYDHKQLKGYRYLVIRGLDNKYQVTLVTGKEKIKNEVVEDLKKIKNVVSIYQNINTTKKVDIMTDDFRHLAFNKTLDFEIDNIKLELLPNSFFQLNKLQAINLYKEAIGLIKDCGLLVEAYCGIGTMSLMASHKCERIIGIEYIDNAIRNAKHMAKLNGINNVEFICGDAAKTMRKINDKIDYLLVDPPRTGLNDEMLEAIKKKRPKNIIYISCNPSSLGKNINELKMYEVKKVKGFDMFSQTPHVECLCLLTLK